MINSMDTVLKHGLTMLNMKANMRMEKNTVKEFYILLMAPNTRECSSITISTDKGLISGLTIGCIWDNGAKIK